MDTPLSIEEPARVRFWRDHQQREVDFVVPRTRSAVDAYECKWSPLHTDTRNLRAFRAAYPDGRNFLVVPQLAEPVPRLRDGLRLELVTPRHLAPAQVSQCEPRLESAALGRAGLARLDLLPTNKSGGHSVVS